MSNDALKIPKRTMPVRLRLRDGAVFEGSLFLGTCSPVHEGPERIHEYLNEQTEFFPVRMSDGEIRLVGKNDVAAVSTPLDRLDSHGMPVDFSIWGEARVRIVDGTILAGVVNLAETTNADPRILDVLNTERPFFTMRTADELVVVSKRSVAWVVPSRVGTGDPAANPREEASHV